MPQWVVSIWGPDQEHTDRVLRVEADDWLSALGAARRKLGDPASAVGLMCQLRADGLLVLSDPRTDRRFALHRLDPDVPYGAELVLAPARVASRPRLSPPAAAAEQTPSDSRIAWPAGPVAPLPEAPIAPATPSNPALGRDPFDEPPRTTDQIDRLLAAIFADCQDLDLCASADEAAEYAVDLAVANIRSETGLVLLYDDDRQRLAVVAARGAQADALIGVELSIGEGVAGFVVQQGIGLNVPDVATHRRFAGDAKAEVPDARSVVCAPIAVNNRVLGAIELVNRVGQTRHFTDGELDALSYIARRLGEALA